MPIYKMDGKKDGLQKYRVRINYVDREGKHKQLERVAYGKENAKDLERKLNMDLKSGELTTSRMTVQELYDEYIKVKSYELRESTLDRSRKVLKTYVLPSLGDRRIDKLNASVLQEWKLSLQEIRTSKGNPLSVEYKKKIFSTFRTLLNYAVKMEYIPKNYLSIIGSFKDDTIETRSMDYYTPEEFKKFIAVAHERAEREISSIFEWGFYVFFNIAFYTGMRKGEINALKWTDIENHTIHVRRSIAQKLKGGDRETLPKNKSSIRDIQIPLPLATVLAEHRSRCQNVSSFTDDWRVCGGIKCLRDSTIQHRNEAYAKASGIKTIRIHDFRHSHASVLANSGINIQEIARRLGHSNVQETWNTYSHMYPAESERAVQVLNNI